MRVEKEKHKVSIICEDGSLVKGLVHINPGERMVDFFNDEKESFIAVTDVHFYNIKDIHSFRLISDISKKKQAVILNKAAIKLVEEI